jgi:hypothetical protein
MDVAMALAVSWKPFVKSNSNAVTMTIGTIVSIAGSLPSPAKRRMNREFIES